MAIKITENGVVRYENEPNVNRLLFPNTPDCGHCSEQIGALSEQIGELKENLTDLQELADTKAAAIYETTSGEIASFSDGADDMPLKSCVVNIEPIQEGTGDPSSENVRPISGRTGLNVFKCGKNLLDTRTVSSGKGLTITKNADGSIHVAGTPTGTWIDFSSAYNVYIPAGNYTLSLQSEIPCNFVLYSFYENDTNRNTNTITNGYKLKTVSFESNVDRIYIGLSGLNTSTAYDFTIYPQLKIGSTATDYEPYKASTYSVNWETEAGSVYGGTLDIVSGKLTVDRARVVFDGSEAWSAYAAQNGFIIIIPSMISGSGLNGITNWLKTIISMSNFGACFGASNNVMYCCHITDNISGVTDVASWKAYLANNNLEVCYSLATPTEIQLTQQEIRTLLGENNIWSDAGDMAVEYPADTKMYIQRLTGSDEDDMTANTNIPDAAYFLISNTLYKSTAAIASGDPIVPGTNCTITNIAEALNALNTTT